METVEELKKRVKELEQQNLFLQNKLNLYERPSYNRAFYVGQKVLNQQVEYLDKFDFEKEIGSNPKEDKIFDRAMETYEKLTLNASKLNSLRIELSLTGDEKKDTKIDKIPYSPESVADQVGELAGAKL